MALCEFKEVGCLDFTDIVNMEGRNRKESQGPEWITECSNQVSKETRI